MSCLHRIDSKLPTKRTWPPGVELGTCGDKTFAFVGSGRGSFVGVHEMLDATTPVWVQPVATGISPEGLLANPDRGLERLSAPPDFDLHDVEMVIVGPDW